MHFEYIGLAVEAAARVRLVEGKLRAVQLGNSKNRFGIVFDRGHETDSDFAQLGRVPVRPLVRGAVIGNRIRLDKPVVIRLCEAPVGHRFVRHVGVALRRLVVVGLFVLRPGRHRH